MNQRREDRLTEIPRPPRAAGAPRPGEGVPVTAAAVADLARRTTPDVDEERW